jgi:hypothetical protein
MRPVFQNIPAVSAICLACCLSLTGCGGFSATGGPDGKPGLFIDGVKLTPMYVRDNRLVGVMQALDIVDGAGRITRPDLKELAAGLREDNNPVIVVATLKN